MSSLLSSSPRPAPSGSSQRGLITLLTLLIVLGQMSTSLYTPSLPSMADALSADPAEVKLTMTVFLLAFAFAQLVYGPLSDRLGRRPTLIAGLVIYFLGTLVCTIAPTLLVLIFGRAIQAFGACAGPSIARAIVRDRYDRTEAARVLSVIGLAMAAGPVLGPLLGGKLQVLFGWRAGFVFLILFGLAMLVAVVRYLTESLEEPDPAATDLGRLLMNSAVLLSDRAYLGYCLIVGFCFGGLFAYTTGAPFVLIELVGLSPDIFGSLFLFTVAGYAVGMAASGQLVRRLDLDRLIGIGAAIMVAGGGAMWAVIEAGHLSTTLIVATMSVFMLGFGVVLPNAMAGAMAPYPGMAGVASAWLGFAQMGVAALGSYAVGLLYDETATPVAGIVAMCAAGVALSLLLLVRPGRKPGA